jgi:hypothetical protein
MRQLGQFLTRLFIAFAILGGLGLTLWSLLKVSGFV